MVLGVLQVVVAVVRLHLGGGEGQGQHVDGRLVEELLVRAVLVDQVDDLLVIHIFTMLTVSGLLLCNEKISAMSNL